MTAPTIFVALFSKLKALSLTTKVVATIATVTVIGGSATAIVILSNHDKQTTETPVINLQQKEVEETEEILFETIEETDDTVAEGTTKVKQEGRNGILTKKYLVTYENDVEVAREKISEIVTTEPTSKIIAIGAKKPPIVMQPSTPNTISTTQDCSLPEGWGRPTSCPPETRSEFTAKGGWERLARMGYSGAQDFRGKVDYDITGRVFIHSELCKGSVSISLDTLEIVEAFWDDQPTSTCDNVRNDHPPIPSVDYLNQYLKSL